MLQMKQNHRSTSFYSLLKVAEEVNSRLENAAVVTTFEGLDGAPCPIPPPRTKFSTPTPSTPTLTRRGSATDPRRRRPESAGVIVDGPRAQDHHGIGSRRPRLEATSAAATAAAAAELGGLPYKHRSLHMPLAPIEGKKLCKKGPADLSGEPVVAVPFAPLRKMMSEESHDYSEIFSPNADDCDDGECGGESQPDSSSDYGAKKENARTGSGDSGLTGISSTGTAEAAVGAPAPPLHRYPSWEDRIYRVAREGFPQVEGASEGGNSRNSIYGGYGNDIVVPVYASVKGVWSS